MINLEFLSLILSAISVLLGIYGIYLTHSVKKAVTQTEKLIHMRNIKLDLSNRLYAISRECTSDNISELHELLSEMIKNEKLPNNQNIETGRDELEYHIRRGLPSDDVITSGAITTDYNRAYAAARTYITNINAESL